MIARAAMGNHVSAWKRTATSTIFFLLYVFINLEPMSCAIGLAMPVKEERNPMSFSVALSLRAKGVM